MKWKIGTILGGIFLAGTVYSYMCLVCIANHNFVSEQDYARMSQEIVEQSIAAPDQKEASIPCCQNTF